MNGISLRLASRIFDKRTGRYILQPEIFDILAAEKRGAGGEIQIADAMIELAGKQPFYGLEFEDRSFDCGSKVGFLAATLLSNLLCILIARTFATQMEALKRYRTGGEQKVTVQHVSVSEGGQAIVGNVTQAPAKTAPKKADQRLSSHL
jgi:hypothetical protein